MTSAFFEQAWADAGVIVRDFVPLLVFLIGLYIAERIGRFIINAFKPQERG
jgi:hypothetical protein